MKTKIKILFMILIISACQSSTEIPLPTLEPTSTNLPATQTPKPTSTFIPVSAKDLAGLIISSPILGTPQKHPDIPPPQEITPNGLGIINSEGELIKFAGAGVFESISPSGTKIVYQQGFEDEYTDYIDNLFVYDLMTGTTTEIFDDIEDEGGKTTISWLKNEQEFIYYNDYYAVLFEAWGYFQPKQLFLADIETGKTKFLTEGYQFDVSPDATQIAYTQGYLLEINSNINGVDVIKKFGCFQPYIYDIALSTSYSFDNNGLVENPLCLGYPKWSPNGKYIAWIGYFEDITFRPVIFNLEDGTGITYTALDKKPEGFVIPIYWIFSDKYIGDLQWIDNTTFWTPSYEVDIKTGVISEPRIIEIPYSPRIESFNKSLKVSMNEKRDKVLVFDKSDNLLVSFLINDLYSGTKYEIFTNGFFLSGSTHIVDWSPFAPPNVGNN